MDINQPRGDVALSHIDFFGIATKRPLRNKADYLVPLHNQRLAGYQLVG
jgi:hypothetical protein